MSRIVFLSEVKTRNAVSIHKTLRVVGKIVSVDTLRQIAVIEDESCRLNVDVSRLEDMSGINEFSQWMQFIGRFSTISEEISVENTLFRAYSARSLRDIDIALYKDIVKEVRSAEERGFAPLNEFNI